MPTSRIETIADPMLSAKTEPNPIDGSVLNPKTPSLGDFMRFGRYTLFIVFLYETMLLPQMLNMTFMVYGGLAPKVLSCGESEFSNLSTVESCSAFRLESQKSGCIPQLQSDFISLASEFGYFCDSIVSIKKAISILMFGVLCGALTFGQLSDWFGRKRMLLVIHLGIGLLDLVASRSEMLTHFVGVQFFTMVFIGGHNAIMHVFLLENVPKKHRVWITCALSYSPNYVIQSVIAYYVGEWRSLLRVAAFLNFPAFFLLFPRWLIQKGYLDSARRDLHRIERWNGTLTDERSREVDSIIEKEISNIVNKGFRLATSIISYALIFNMEHLSGSIYVSTALFGLFRWAMNLVVGSADYFIPRAGRKAVHTAALIFILAMLSIVIAAKFADYPMAMAAMFWKMREVVVLLLISLTIISHVSGGEVIDGLELLPNASSSVFLDDVRAISSTFLEVASKLGPLSELIKKINEVNDEDLQKLAIQALSKKITAEENHLSKKFVMDTLLLKTDALSYQTRIIIPMEKLQDAIFQFHVNPKAQKQELLEVCHSERPWALLHAMANILTMCDDVTALNSVHGHVKRFLNEYNFKSPSSDVEAEIYYELFLIFDKSNSAPAFVREIEKQLHYVGCYKNAPCNPADVLRAVKFVGAPSLRDEASNVRCFLKSVIVNSQMQNSPLEQFVLNVRQQLEELITMGDYCFTDDVLSEFKQAAPNLAAEIVSNLTIVLNSTLNAAMESALSSHFEICVKSFSKDIKNPKGMAAHCRKEVSKYGQSWWNHVVIVVWMGHNEMLNCHHQCTCVAMTPFDFIHSVRNETFDQTQKLLIGVDRQVLDAYRTHGTLKRQFLSTQQNVNRLISSTIGRIDNDESAVFGIDGPNTTYAISKPVIADYIWRYRIEHF